MKNILTIYLFLFSSLLYSQSIQGEWIEEYQFDFGCLNDTLYYSKFYKNLNITNVQPRFKYNIARYFKIDSNYIMICTPFNRQQMLYRIPIKDKKKWKFERVTYKLKEDSLFSNSNTDIGNYKRVYQDSNMIIWSQVDSWLYDIRFRVWTKQRNNEVMLDDYFIISFIKEIIKEKECRSVILFDNRNRREVKEKLENDKNNWEKVKNYPLNPW